MSNYLSRLVERANPVKPIPSHYVPHPMHASLPHTSLTEESDPFERTTATFAETMAAETMQPESNAPAIANIVPPPAVNEAVKADALQAESPTRSNANVPALQVLGRAREVVKETAATGEKISRGQRRIPHRQEERLIQATHPFAEYSRIPGTPISDGSLPDNVDGEPHSPHSEHALGQEAYISANPSVVRPQQVGQPKATSMDAAALLPSESSLSETDLPFVEVPRLVIGQLTVEILPDKSLSAPHEQSIRITNIVQPASSRHSSRSKLRFGLGQL